QRPRIPVALIGQDGFRLAIELRVVPGIPSREGLPPQRIGQQLAARNDQRALTGKAGRQTVPRVILESIGDDLGDDVWSDIREGTAADDVLPHSLSLVPYRQAPRPLTRLESQAT